MEDLLTKYGVNLNNYSEDYDLVVFLCKDCAEDLKYRNPYVYKHGGGISLSKIKVIEVEKDDCENSETNLNVNPQRIKPIPLYIDLYTIQITTYETELREPQGHEYRISGTDLLILKNKINDVIWESIECDGLDGDVKVEVQITKDGEYVDGDELDIRIVDLKFTDEPSRYVVWHKNQIPDRFTVDRKASVVEGLDAD